jgi:hypothetical protein
MIKRQVMKTYGGVQVKLRAFTILVLYSQGNEPTVHIRQEVGLTPEPGLDAAIVGNRIPRHPTSNQLLKPLRGA